MGIDFPIRILQIIILKEEVQWNPSRRWLIVYTCKVPAVVEGYKKIRVAFFEINDWINDCICNLNLIFYKSDILDVARFFCTPDRRLGRRLHFQSLSVLNGTFVEISMRS